MDGGSIPPGSTIWVIRGHPTRSEDFHKTRIKRGFFYAFGVLGALQPAVEFRGQLGATLGQLVKHEQKLPPDAPHRQDRAKRQARCQSRSHVRPRRPVSRGFAPRRQVVAPQISLRGEGKARVPRCSALQSIVTGSRSLRLIRCGPPVKLSYTLNQASILRARSVKIEFGFALFGTAKSMSMTLI